MLDCLFAVVSRPLVFLFKWYGKCGSHSESHFSAGREMKICVFERFG